MGKGFLLVAGAFLLMIMQIMLSNQRTGLSMQERQTEAQEKALAREEAQSSLSHVLSVIQRDIRSAPDGTLTVPGTDAIVTATPVEYGTVELDIAGLSGEADHTIDATVVYKAPMPAALLLNADELTVNHDGSAYLISGVDMRMPSHGGAPGVLRPVSAIQTNHPAHQAALQQDLAADQVVGDGGSSSVDATLDEAFVQQLYDEAMAEADVTYAGPITLSGTFGSSSNPQIVVVDGDLTVTGSLSGTGVLLVKNGDLLIDSSDFQWEGLVLAHDASGLTVRMDGGARLYGSLMAVGRQLGELDAACVPPFSIVGNQTIPQVDYTLRTEVIGAAISYGGQYDMPVTTQIVVGSDTREPWNAFDLPVDANVNRDGSFVYEPQEVFAAGTGLAVNGRSWKLQADASGASNDDWTVHMEKNSTVLDNQLKVLRDGDVAPSIDGYLGQTSVEEYLTDYIVDGVVTLEANQAIYLFELGVNNTSSSAHDYQDLVVLATMVPAASDMSVAGTSSSTALCPLTSEDAGRLEFHINDGSQIHHSGEAIAKLGQRLDTIREATTVTIVRQEEQVTGRRDRVAQTQSQTVQHDGN